MLQLKQLFKDIIEVIIIVELPFPSQSLSSLASARSLLLNTSNAMQFMLS